VTVVGILDIFNAAYLAVVNPSMVNGRVRFLVEVVCVAMK
jgi:hypothetical protein